MSDSRWIICSKRRPDASVQLVCAPNAGAGILTFRAWAGSLPAAEIWCIQLPGRDARRSDPFYMSIEQVADSVAPSLFELRARPVVLFGHSMGALVAFELARRLERGGHPPSALVVAGRRGPSLPGRLPPIAHLPPDEFVTAVRERFPGIPEPVLTDSELAPLFLPTLRADLAMVEAYQYQKTSPLSCPILVYGGKADPHTTLEELQAWSQETAGPCEVRWFPGGHLFVETARDEVLAALRRDLALCGPRPAA